MRILVSVMLVLAVPALAQTEEAKKKPRVQKVDFGDGTDIEGGRTVPLGDIYMPPPKAVFGRLIKVRMNFDDKLRESVHEM